MRRRTWLPLLGLVGALLALAAGGALAATMLCPFEPAARCTGTAGDDAIYGTADGDRIFGRRGNDGIFAGYGDDRLDGGDGADTLSGGPGRDALVGGPGDDQLHADDGVADAVDCGPGQRDEAWFDRGLDAVTYCERTHPLSLGAAW